MPGKHRWNSKQLLTKIITKSKVPINRKNERIIFNINLKVQRGV